MPSRSPPPPGPDVDFVVFRVVAPIAAWGDLTTGERRTTANRPSHSAICGLVASALGMPRALPEDAPVTHEQLSSSFTMAVRTDRLGTGFRDFHTVQRRLAKDDGTYATRREELSRTDALYTVTSQRDYLTDVAYVVVLRVSPEGPVDPHRIARALNAPVYAPYVGRRCCPLGAPVAARVVDAPDAISAMGAYDALVRVESDASDAPRPVAMDASLAREAGVDDGRTEQRRDKVRDRARRQFDLRAELVTFVPGARSRHAR